MAGHPRRPTRMRVPLGLLGPGLLCMGLLAGCVGGGASTPAVTTTTMAATAAIANLAPTTLAGADPDGSVPGATETDSGAAPADAQTDRPTTGLPTPQAAARNLWDAWRDADVPRALLYAAAPASETLMATPWGPEVRQAGCTAVESGWLCRFEGPTIRWDLGINGNDSLGYRVRTVSTGAPNGIVLSPPPAGQPAGSAPVDTLGAPSGGSSVDTVVDGVLDHHGPVVVPESATTSVVDAAARRTRTSKRRVTATTTATAAPGDTTPAVTADATPAPPPSAAEPAAPAPAPVPVARPAQSAG